MDGGCTAPGLDQSCSHTWKTWKVRDQLPSHREHINKVKCPGKTEVVQENDSFCAPYKVDTDGWEGLLVQSQQVCCCWMDTGRVWTLHWSCLVVNTKQHSGGRYDICTNKYGVESRIKGCGFTNVTQTGPGKPGKHKVKEQVKYPGKS